MSCVECVLEMRSSNGRESPLMKGFFIIALNVKRKQ